MSDQPKPASGETPQGNDDWVELAGATKPASDEWTVHEDGYGILEWHPKHKDGVGMLCRCHDRMEAEYTVNAHNAAIAAAKENSLREILDWESGYKCGKAEVSVQLAAEREKHHNLWDVYKENRQLREQLAAAQSQDLPTLKLLREQLAAEREKCDQAIHNCMIHRRRATELEAQLAAEREWANDYKASFEQVSKQLAAERQKNWIRAEDNPGYNRHE